MSVPPPYSTRAVGEETPDPIVTTAAVGEEITTLGLGEEVEATTQRVGEEVPTDGIAGIEDPIYTTQAVGEETPGTTSDGTVENPFGGF